MKIQLPFIVVICLIFVNISYSQNWYDCGSASSEGDFRSTENKFANIFKDVTMKIKATHVSCPGGKTGEIEILENPKDENGNYIDCEFDIFNQDGNERKELNDPGKISNLGSGTYTIIAYSAGKYMFAFMVAIQEDKYGRQIILETLINETCPGSKDGYAKLKSKTRAVGGFETLTWGNGSVGFERGDLAAGKYPFKYQFSHFNGACCFDGQVIISSNYCPIEIYEENLADGVPESWFVDIPQNIVVENGNIQFSGDACVFIPFNTLNVGDDIVARIDINGPAELSIIDVNMNPLASRLVSGNDAEKINLLNPQVTHFYFKIKGNAGTVIDNIKIESFEENIKPLDLSSAFHENSKIFRDNPVITYCLGDTLFPFTGFEVTGGVTPYSFNWALDGDMIFNDADSIGHPIFFDEQGTHVIAIEIQDDIGQRDTVIYEYESYEVNVITMNIPDLGLIDIRNQFVDVCLSDPPFAMNVTQGISLSSETADVSDSSFNPADAGLGFHFIHATGNVCDSSATLVVEVIDVQNNEFSMLPEYAQCEETLQLLTLTESLGLWILDDSIALLANELDFGLLDTGVHILIHSSGGVMCFEEYEQAFSVSPAPQAKINVSDTIITSSDNPIDLNLLLSSESTMGGTWSGETIDGNIFNPEGLAGNTYIITYTIGEGNCFSSDSISVEVVGPNSSYDLTLIFGSTIYPNPVRDELFIELHNSQNTLRTFEIIDLRGMVIMSFMSNEKVIKIDTNGMNKGVYFVRLSAENEKSSIKKFTKI